MSQTEYEEIEMLQRNIRDLRAELEKAHRECIRLHNEKVPIETALFDVRQELSVVRAELDKAQLLVQRLDSENTQYCGKLADCKRELDKAQRERDECIQLSIDRFRKIDILRQQLSDSQQQLTLAREELANCNDLVKGLEGNLKACEEELAASEAKRKELVSQASALHRALLEADYLLDHAEANSYNSAVNWVPATLAIKKTIDDFGAWSTQATTQATKEAK